MKRRAFSLLLSLTLLLSLALPATTAYAEDGSSNKGMEISKTATANQDGSYTITLEAYATGEKVISEITKDVPTDIILVLDQSGSMAKDIGTVSFKQYEDETNWWGDVSTYHTRNQDYYEYRHNGGSSNLWHKLADGSYVSVSVTRQENPKYTPITNGKNNSTFGGATSYWNNQDNLYALVHGKYLKVTVERTRYNGTYTYTLPDGTQIASQSGASQSPKFTGIDGNVIYLVAVNDAETTYTYTYTDSAGVVQTIDTSTGAKTVFSPTLYERVTSTSGGGTRLNALKNAATTFASAVATKAAGEDGDITTTADNVNHRIAVVGYADTDWDYGYNTGVFIGSTLNRYENNAARVYGTALQDMSTTNGKSNVAASLDALQASGATRTDYGLTMANGILNANPVPTGETRNRVVIVFTDGSPTNSNGFQRAVANRAISTANAIKAGGTTVYSIGIFSGADATSAGTEPSEDLDDSSGQLTAACNWFMQKVSSNNGTPRTPSYYLSAADADSLNSIFQQISDQIESGGSSSTLTSEAVVKDIISPYFTLPEDATNSSITLETYACTGKDAKGGYTWSKNADAMGANATINGDQVNVTGFNFSENYVGTVTENGNTTYRGNKLVISFPVVVKEGFLGGNGVYTNSKAGVYENASSINPVLEFNRPQVDVKIEDVTVTAPEKNVYLMGDLTADQIKDGVTVDCGGVAIDLSKDNENYGLETWQNEYVDIAVTYTDKKGNTLTNLNDLTDDTTYTVSVKVSPKTKTGTAKEKTGSGNGNINVFKPELTFKDSTAYYGETVPTGNDFSANKVSEVWKHNTTEDSSVTMTGERPTLNISYTPDVGKLNSGKYTKQDVPVSATVKIGEENVNGYTAFLHQKCTGKTCALPEGYHFWIHIQTCTLTITKQGGADGEPYVFDICKDGEKYSEVTIVGNDTQTLYELPVGTYTIKEDTGWSWRYSVDNGGSAALTAQYPTGSITCTNTKNNDKWLNGFSNVEKNISDGSHNN